MHPWTSTACQCTVAAFGLTVAAVLNDSRWFDLARDLDVVELESGVEAVTRAGLERGHRAVAFDILRDPINEDILSKGGFHKAVSLVMRLRAGGLLGQAPVCSSWVGLNTKNTKRTKDNYQGNESYEPVRLGNRMAEATMLLMALAIVSPACFVSAL